MPKNAPIPRWNNFFNFGFNCTKSWIFLIQLIVIYNTEHISQVLCVRMYRAMYLKLEKKMWNYLPRFLFAPQNLTDPRGDRLQLMWIRHYFFFFIRWSAVPWVSWEKYVAQWYLSARINWINLHRTAIDSRRGGWPPGGRRSRRTGSWRRCRACSIWTRWVTRGKDSVLFPKDF